MILRNVTLKYNCIAEFAGCYVPQAFALPSASRYQSDRFSNRSIVYLELALCCYFLSVCLKRDQFL